MTVLLAISALLLRLVIALRFQRGSRKIHLLTRVSSLQPLKPLKPQKPLHSVPQPALPYFQIYSRKVKSDIPFHLSRSSPTLTTLATTLSPKHNQVTTTG